MLLSSVLVSAAILALFVGLDRFIRSRTADIETRVQLAAAEQLAGSARADSQASRARGLNRWLSATAGDQIATDLARADLHLTASEYLLILFASTLIGFLAGFLIFRGTLLMGLVGALLGYKLPDFYLHRLQRKRIHAFNTQLSDTVTLLASSLRSGYSLLQAIDMVTREMNPPVSYEFSRVTREVALGLTVQQALHSLLRRVPSDDLDMLVTAVSIQHEVGGNLAEILDTIALTIRERVRILGEIRSITAQQRMSGVVLSLLPIGLGVLLYALNPTYMSRLWENMCGISLLIVGAILTGIGFVIVRRIASIEV
ncbi:MAG: type II secretion system F family protein [Rudaea sp.]